MLAVFGVPRVHEDDGLRAVRAAVEMREALARLNEEFQPSWGVTIAARTGMNTGEVLVGVPSDGEALILGDAVNIAARLEQAAEPGEILIGDDTYRLVRDVIAAEPVGPLDLKGIAKPVAAWRLLGLVSGASGSSRRLDAELVGRLEELAELKHAFERSATAGTCRLVTVMGDAGGGKSRLRRELLSRIGDRATALQDAAFPTATASRSGRSRRCSGTPGGSAIVIRRQRPCVSSRRCSPTRPRASPFAARWPHSSGWGRARPGIQETFWAVRKLFEHLGARRPLVVVFDDIHWGEQTFLDLLEYLADRIDATPILIICETRPELFDVRPGWMTGHPNASLIALKGLTGGETATLISNLVGGADVPPKVCARITELSEGIPLFVEETLRMLIDDGVLLRNGKGWTVTGNLAEVSIPPSIEALLRARLDRLEPEERAVIQRASVCGRSFWWGAVSELSPPEVRPWVGTHLQALMRKELIVPGGTEIGHEDAFRFRHILIRDAAYRGLPKGLRAEMHEQLADWIEERTARSHRGVRGDRRLSPRAGVQVAPRPRTDDRADEVSGEASRRASGLHGGACLRARRHAGGSQPPHSRGEPHRDRRPSAAGAPARSRVRADGDGRLREAPERRRGAQPGRHRDRRQEPARARGDRGLVDPPVHESRGMGRRGGRRRQAGRLGVRGDGRREWPHQGLVAPWPGAHDERPLRERGRRMGESGHARALRG